MYCKLFVVTFVTGFLLRITIEEVPSFRILAPPFVCPKDKDAVIDQPDNTVITLQTDTVLDIKFSWIVRWKPLIAPTQRFTLALWRSVHKLEKQLNGTQVEPGVYIINNTELLSGVNYIFNVTASLPDSKEVVNKSFNIDNIKGDPKLLIEGRTNLFSVILVGGQMTYTDLDFLLEAQVTSCSKTQDYYFVWSVTSGETSVDVSDIKGSRLEIAANRLKPGFSYNVLCSVFKYSNEEFITTTRLPIRVHHRELKVNFNIDVLVISVYTPFSVQTDIKTADYYQNAFEVTWQCSINNETFEDFDIFDVETLNFPSGLPAIGEYSVSVSVRLLGDGLSAHSIARIIVVEPQLPVIEVGLTPKLVNKGSIVHLNANISSITPGCSIIWYFLSDKYISTTNASNAGDCSESEHGSPISEPINFYSLEENFLSELTDYSNETSWKSVTGVLEAVSGTARIVAKCECNKIDNCTTEGTVYADVKLTVNDKPDAGEVLITPETGTAMETLFRISILAVIDPNRPLRYTFYCDLTINDSLILGTYLEHLAIETLLPFKDGGTSVWVEVCDSLGACASGTPTVVDLTKGEGRTLDTLMEEFRALVLRCEIGLMQRLVSSAITTYVNTDQADANIKFTNFVLLTLRDIHQNCTDRHSDQYNSFLYWMANAGVDTTSLEWIV